MDFLFEFLALFLEVLSFVIILRVIISWVSRGQNNWLTTLLYQVTEPILGPLRRILPKFGMLDFSPMAAIIILRIVIIIIS